MTRFAEGPRYDPAKIPPGGGPHPKIDQNFLAEIEAEAGRTRPLSEPYVRAEPRRLPDRTEVTFSARITLSCFGPEHGRGMIHGALAQGIGRKRGDWEITLGD